MDESHDLFKNWKRDINLLYLDVVVYTDYIINQISSNIELNKDYKKLKKNVDVIQKISSKEFYLKSSEDIFNVIFYIDDLTQQLKNLIELVTDKKYLISIERSMSGTYYETILNKNKKLHKKIEKIEILVNDITNYIINNIDTKLILDTPLHQFEKLYIDNISSTSMLLFNKYINVYEKNNINVSNLTQKIYDYILGYRNEIFNDKPYSSHPLLLMGLTFNLTPNSNLISSNELKQLSNSGIITINNQIVNSDYIILYNIEELLNGKYSTINKNNSINRSTVLYSQTIKTIPISNNNDNTTGIQYIKTDNKSTITVYETIDSGINFRRIGPPTLSFDKIKYIDKGPKPRVYLYNTECMKILNSLPNIKHGKTIEKNKIEYVEVDHLLKIKNLEAMHLALFKEQREKNSEIRLYNLYKANMYLRDIRRVIKKTNIAIKIPFEEYSIIKLF